VSVVIGKNGIGKSRLLAGIADIFETLDSGKSRRRSSDLSVSQLSYAVDGHRCELETEGLSRLSAKIDGRRCELAELPLPNKVIALTTTPFDKFRISRSLLSMPGKDEPDGVERYVYLGLRDRTGRASPTAVIFRALEGMFAASSSEASRRFRISEVFRFLGYEPHMEVRYEFSSTNMRRLEQIVAGDPVEQWIEPVRANNYRSPLVRMLEREPSLLGDMRNIGEEVLGRAKGSRSFSLRADFEGTSVDEIFFQNVQLLRRADLIRMHAIEIERISDGAVLDMRLASSGELGIVTGFLGLASVIEDGSLIFVDEPEISLHPEWQVRYIDLLLKTFGHFSGCHFVLATHSPLILSDITPENSNVVSLDANRREAEDAEAFAGQSYDYLLATAFQVPGKNNLYLKQEIIKALRLAATGNAATDEFASIVAGMVDLLPKMERDSPVARLIRELQAAGKASASAK
jgi:predicted ATPase